jgi:hypothetical protein
MMKLPDRADIGVIVFRMTASLALAALGLIALSSCSSGQPASGVN